MGFEGLLFEGLLEPVPVFVYAASAHAKGNGPPFDRGDPGKIRLRTHNASRETLDSLFHAVTRPVWGGVYAEEQANRAKPPAGKNA